MSAVAESEPSVAETGVLPQPRKLVLEMPEYHPPLAGREALRLAHRGDTLSQTLPVKLSGEQTRASPEYEPNAVGRQCWVSVVGTRRRIGELPFHSGLERDYVQ